MEKRANAKRGMDDFLFFCNFMCGFKDINREEHGEFIAAIEDVVREVGGRRKRAERGDATPDDSLKLTVHTEAARGTFKTSLWIAFICRLIVADRQVAIRFNMNKIENSEKKVASIGKMLRLGRIPDHYGKFHTPGGWSKRALHLEENVTPDPTVSAGGLDERQTGTHCDVIINSDVQDEANSLTAELRRGVEQWRSDEQSLFRQNSRYRLEVWDSTRWHDMDVAGQLVELGSRKPRPKRFWLIRKPVADVREWMRNPDTASLGFPILFPRPKVKELFDPSKSGLREFDVYAQYFLDTSRNVHTKFKAEWLSPGPRYNPRAVPDNMAETNVCLLPKRLNLFVTIDPADPDAIQKMRDKGDFESARDKCDTGMVLSAMDEQKNTIMLAAVTGQMTIPEMGDQIIKWFRAYHLPDKTKTPAACPLFGAKERYPRQWTMVRCGVEKAGFSALLLQPLKSYLTAHPGIGREWANRLINDRSAIQISTQKSKAGRQDATEVDYASGKWRIGQHQTDIDAGADHPASALVEAKREYPSVSKWDVLDAETLCSGKGFMSAPYEVTSESRVFQDELRKKLDAEIALMQGGYDAVNDYYHKQRLAAQGGGNTNYGCGEFVGVG